MDRSSEKYDINSMSTSAEESIALDDADLSCDASARERPCDCPVMLRQGDVEEAAEVWAATNGWAQDKSRAFVSPDGNKTLQIKRIDPKSGSIEIRCNSGQFYVTIYQNPLRSDRFHVNVSSESWTMARCTCCINSALESGDDQSLEESLHTILTSLAIYANTEHKTPESTVQTGINITHVLSDRLKRCTTVESDPSGHQITATIRLSCLNVNARTLKYLEMEASDTLKVTLQIDGHTSIFEKRQGRPNAPLTADQCREARLMRTDSSSVLTSSFKFLSYGVKEYIPNILNRIIDEYNDLITLDFEQQDDAQEKKTKRAKGDNNTTAAEKKTFVYVLENLVQRIEDPGKFCVYCAEELKVGGDIPRPCQKDLCRFIYEENGANMSLIHFFRDEKTTGVKSNKDTLLSLKFQVVAALWSTYHPKLALAYEPFPSFMLSDPVHRHRAGVFENGSLPKSSGLKRSRRSASAQAAVTPASNNPAASAPAPAPASSPANSSSMQQVLGTTLGSASTGDGGGSNSSSSSSSSISSLIRSCFPTFPHPLPILPPPGYTNVLAAMSSLVKSKNEQDLECEYKSQSLSVIVSELGSLPWNELANAEDEVALSRLLSRLQYKLLRHLLLSSPVKLVPLHDDSRRGSMWRNKLTEGHQFEYRGDQTEAAKEFERRRFSPGSPLTERNTVFAFHGTPIYNLHTVLRFGLLNMTGTIGMENGSSLGKGVYFSTSIQTALSYSMKMNHTLENMVDVSEAVSRQYSNKTRIVLVCEVFQDCISKHQQRFSGNCPSIFTVRDVKNVAIRYVLAVPPPLDLLSSNGQPFSANDDWSFNGELITVEAFQKHFEDSSYMASIRRQYTRQAASAAATILPPSPSSEASSPAAKIALVQPIPTPTPTPTPTSTPSPTTQRIQNEYTTPEATTAVTRSLKLMNKETSYRVDLVDDNMFCWRVFLSGFEQEQGTSSADQQQLGTGPRMPSPDQSFSHQLALWAATHGAPCAVEIELLFSKCNYPTSPPFVRVVRPRLSYRTGHVTVGGSICTYNLTPSGWNPGNSIVTIVEMVKVLLIEGGATIANYSDGGAYSYSAAYEAYERVRWQHGWV